MRERRGKEKQREGRRKKEGREGARREGRRKKGGRKGYREREGEIKERMERKEEGRKGRLMASVLNDITFTCRRGEVLWFLLDT